MDCPICTLPMFAYDNRGVELDACANDHTFFDLGEITSVLPDGALLEEQLMERVTDAEPGKRRCPRCSTAMLETAHETRRAGVCPGCGGIVLWSAVPDLTATSPSQRASSGASGSDVLTTSILIADVGLDIGLDTDLGEGALDAGAALVGGAGSALDLVGSAASATAELSSHLISGVLEFLGALLES